MLPVLGRAARASRCLAGGRWWARPREERRLVVPELAPAASAGAGLATVTTATTAAPPGGRVRAAAAAREPAAGLEADEADDGEDALEPPEADDPGVGVHTGGAAWGAAAAAAAQKILSTDPALSALALWSLSADARAGRLAIRLDKPADEYGSPSLDEVAAFAAAFGPAFEEAAGVAAADAVEVEVSSPGAERSLRVPGDLPRFARLPMAVRLSDAAAAAAVAAGCGPPKGAPPRPPGAPFLFRLVGVEGEGDGGKIVWAPADVRANRGPTGRLTKAQREARAVVGVGDVAGVRLHLDV